jgi:hypothetical protein
MVRGGSALVEHLPRHSKFKDLSPEDEAGKSSC